MPSTNQSGRDNATIPTPERQVRDWPAKRLVMIVPMTKQSTLDYWNACNRVDASDEVRAHFKECLQNVSNE
jgi:hypothetical protein